jgi:hypothetical protein
MANIIPLAYADVELQLSTAISVGSTSFSLSSANDDDGNALPAGKYCFTVDNGLSTKEYLIGQLNGTNVTSVQSVSRQGVESSGAARAHRVGASVILTDFATIQRVADILRGQASLDGSNPIIYDAEPTLADRKELATVGYVLDTATGGTVTFDRQVITGTAGESVSAGELVYFKTSDQEWYKTDADTAATVDGVQLGIALGSGTDGVSITGGVQISGTYTTTGLTAGATYYASNTGGAISSSAGTTSRVVGVALSTTKLLLIPVTPQSLTGGQTAAVVGGGNFGTPSSTNKFVTEAYNASASGLPVVRTYLNAASPATWTKPTGVKYVVVEVQAAGGNGADATTTDNATGGGGGGGYAKKLIAAASLGTTETVTIGAVGASSSFGSHCSATSGTSASADSVTGGAGGSGSSGDINISGSKGGDGFGITVGPSGAGGHSVLGTGAVAAKEGQNGVAGAGYGSGGSGGNADSSTDRSGGAGAPAIVIVTEYYS